MFKTGLLLGKFSPPHKGHKFTIDWASSLCDILVVIVSGGVDFSAEQRTHWLKSEYKDYRKQIIFYADSNPIEEPLVDSEGVAIDDWFWELWISKINTLTGTVDAVFTNDKYGEKLSNLLDAKWIPIDRDRSIFNTSATNIKLGKSEWKNIIYSARLALTKTFCVVGPESVGKTTLVKKLANYFDNSGLVYEYGRTISEIRNNKLTEEDFKLIVRGHKFTVENIKAEYPRVFVDTDAFTTNFFAKKYLSKQEYDNIKYYIACQQHADKYRYNHWLILAPNVPFVADGTRITTENERIAFYEEAIDYYKEEKLPYTIIDSSTFDDRFYQAVTAVEAEKIFKGV